MVGILRLGWGFIAQYRIWLMAGAVVAALTTVTVFYGNARANAVKLVAANDVIKELRLDLSAARIELDARNARIAHMNKRQVEELRAARDLLNKSLAMAETIRAERDKVKAELRKSRTQLKEEIQNDEEFAIWAGDSVHPTAWRLLGSAAEGSGDS